MNSRNRSPVRNSSYNGIRSRSPSPVRNDIYVPPEILQKIANARPSSETSTLMAITRTPNRSVDQAIKMNERNASLSYIANKIALLKDKKKVVGIKNLIDGYVSASFDYNKYAVEIDEIMDLLVGENPFINFLSEEDNRIFLRIATDTDVITTQMFHNVFDKYNARIFGEDDIRFVYEIIIEDPDRITIEIFNTLKKYYFLNKIL